MERKKRVSVGVVLMGFFLIFVMLGAIVGLIAHEVLLREATVGMSSDKETFSVIGALHMLLSLGMKNGGSWVSVLGADAKDYIVIGLMSVGILMFIIAGFTKNHVVYLISLLMTGTSVFMKRLPMLLAEIKLVTILSAAKNPAKGYFTVCFLVDLFIVLAWILLLVVWLISVIKTAKVKKGTGNPDKSLVFGFIPGLLMILVYLGFGAYEALAVATGGPEVQSYVLGREFGSPWAGFRDVEIFGTLAIGTRYLFLSFQFALLILFTGLWLNRPFKRLSAEERAKQLAAERKAAEPKPAPMPYAQQYGPQYNQQYGPSYGPQYNQQYGQPYGPQYNQQYGQQYTQQTDRQYGAPYGQQYGQQAAPQPAPEPRAEYRPEARPEPQPAVQPMPVPVPVPVPEEPVKEEVPETVEEVREELAETVEEVKEETLETVEEVKEETLETAEEVKEEVPQFVEELREETAEAVEEVKEEAAETVEEVKEEAAETVEEVKEEATETAEAVKEELPRYKFCPNCGAPILGGRFCAKCGYKLFD